MPLLDSEAFILHDETFNDWPMHIVGLTDAADWILVKSAYF